MRTKDHKLLAEFLILQMNETTPVICKKAFIYGGVEPDYNPVTYLHGWSYGTKFHGHNYENILPVMRKLFAELQQKEQWGIKEYYHFGKLIHYVADAFTFPHNQIFRGSIADHCAYERKLHEKFEKKLQKEKDILLINRKLSEFSAIEKMHETYILKAGSCEADCEYIFQAAGQVFASEYQKADSVGKMKTKIALG